MRRFALFVALLAGIVFGQPQTGGFGTGGNAGRSGPSFGRSFAFFEFAPTGGAGMGAACACSTPTGAKGETLTFTRTGDATCSRQGLATTGIANGDLVTCTGNQPRVEPSGGVLGLRVEGARTNDILRSEEIDNAVWADVAVGVAAPSVTANAAIAPNNTLTAERVIVPATLSGQSSYKRQGGLGSTNRFATYYVRGNGTSGSINIISGVTPNACASCSYVSNSWTRCVLPSAGANGQSMGFGNDSVSAACGTSGKGAHDVFIWGAQFEAGTYATGYIPTVASAVTRNAEGGTFSGVAVGASPSIAASLAIPTTAGGWPGLTSYATPLTLNNTGGYFLLGFRSTFASVGAETFNTTAGSSYPVTAAEFRSSAGGRIWASGGGSGGTTTVNVAGTLSTYTNPTIPDQYTTVRVGFDGTGSQADGIITRVCVDPDPSRCR